MTLLNRALVHDLIAERYERAATIVTSHLDFDECTNAFAINRLLDWPAALGRARSGLIVTTRAKRGV